MNEFSLVLSVANSAALVLGGLLLRHFLPSYLTEKGKNAASKEDLEHLTNIVEQVRVRHASAIEHLKADLVAEGQTIERRRRAYEEICAGLRVFVDGHGATEEMKERFHAAYAAAWLWASDEVLKALNQFIELQARHSAAPSSVAQEDMKHAYSTTILAMRKDTGFANTLVATSNYRFIQF